MKKVVLKLKEGIFFSEFDDENNGNTYIIRYENRYWKISERVYEILQAINGERSNDELLEYLIEARQISVSEEQLDQIINVVCINNGLLEGTKSQSKRKTNKMLWGRITIIPSQFVEKLRFLTFLFSKKRIYVLSGFVVFWILYIILTNSNDRVLNELLSLRVSDVVLAYVFIMLAGIIHEFGHSVATLKYGGNVGRIGVGVYFIMPVLFSDVTDAWRLKRTQRIIVDAGGMYLQGIFLVICFFINMMFLNNSLLNIAILMSGFQILGNLSPFIKLDGYWILVDYLGEVQIFDVVKKVWMDVWYKFTKRNIRHSQIGKRKRIIVYIYSLFTIIFYVYFARILLNTAIYAINNFSKDITFLIQKGFENIPLSIENVFNYLSSRIISFLMVFFIVRVILMVLNGIIKLIKKKGFILPICIRREKSEAD